MRLPLVCLSVILVVLFLSYSTLAQQVPSPSCSNISRTDVLDTSSNGGVLPFFGGEGAGVTYDVVNGDLYVAENPFTSQGLGVPQVVKIHLADSTRTVLAPPGGFGGVTALGFFNGNLYVADGNGYANYIASGQRVALNVIWQYAPATGIWTQIENVNDPTGLAFDSSGNMYVSSWTDMTVYEFTYDSATQTYFTFPLPLWTAPDPSASPYGIAIDQGDNIYIAGFGQSFNNGTKIFKVDQNGNSTVYFDVGITEPASLAFDTNGYLYASYYDSGEIVRIAPDLSYVVFPGGGTAADAPNGIAITSHGDLFTVVNGSSTSDHNPALLKIEGLVPSINAAAEFSATVNPNGSWSYGYSNAAGFTLLPTSSNMPGTIFGSSQSATPGLDFWMGSGLDAAGPDPDIFYNATSNYLSTYCCNPVSSGALGFQPELNGSASTLRWTSPFAGTYQVVGVWSGLDFYGPTNTAGIVSYNTSPLLSTVVSGFGIPSIHPFFEQSTTAACETLDFTVGSGNTSSNGITQAPPGNNLFTGLDVMVLPAPSAGPFSFAGKSTFWFGAIPAGLTVPITATLTNSGGSGYDLSQATIVGANANDFQITADTCSNHTVAAGATCSITISFFAEGLGARSATLQVNTNTPAVPLATLPLAGIGVLNTELSLSSSASPVNSGAPVTFTATVIPALPSVPVGSVAFYDETTQIGTAAVDSTGKAQFSYAPTTGGSHKISAAYIPAPNQTTFVGISANSIIEAVTPPPTLTSITPSLALTGSTVSVTLSGTGLTGTSAINLSKTGIAVSNISVVNDSTVTATFTIAPSNALSTMTVTVTAATGTSNPVAFTVVPPPPPPVPTLTQIYPSLALAGNTISVTLTGSGLTGTSAINLSGSGVTVSNISVLNDSTVTATFAIAATTPLSPMTVTVTTPGGISNPVPFTVVPPPQTAITLSPGSLSFGFQPVGTSATQSITVGNTGSIPLNFSSIQVQGKQTTAGYINTVVGNGGYGYGGDGGPAINAQLSNPSGVAVDRAGDLFIADYTDHRVRRVDALTGTITTVAGNGTPGYSGDGGLAILAELSEPSAVAVDSAGNLYIADAYNYCVRRVDEAGNITTYAGNGSFGYGGDGGPATAAWLSFVSGLAVDGEGNLYIADFQNSRIRKVDAHGFITTVAGIGNATVSGFGGYNGDGIAATLAALNNPGGVVVDSAGNLFIADTNNSRIRRVDAITGVITTYAGTGTQGYSGDGGPATSAMLSFPGGIAIDYAGNLFLADTWNQRVRRVEMATGLISTVAGNGTPGFSGDGAAATTAEISSPLGIAVDSADTLFISDNMVRIRRVAEATSNSSTEFTESDDCAVDVAPNSTCTIQVTFTPAVSNSRVATLVLTDNHPTSPQQILLSGVGTQPSVLLSPTAVASPNTTYGQSSAAQTVIVANSGNGPLTLSAPTLAGTNPGDFSLSSNACGSTLAPNTNCQIQVKFTPTTGGARSATLQINDNASGSPQVVSLSGTGVAENTTTLVTTSAPVSLQSQPVRFTATVTAAYGTPVGTVTFAYIAPVSSGSSGGKTTTLATIALSPTGVAAYTAPAGTLALGSYPVRATYAGSASFSGSSGSVAEQVVSLCPTTTTLAGGPNPGVLSQNITFTATVSSPCSTLTLTGTVIFSYVPPSSTGTSGGAKPVVLGSGTLSSAGVTSIVVPAIKLGLLPATTTITATYSGSPMFAKSSGTTNEQIMALYPTNTSLSSSPNPVYVSQTVTFTARVTCNYAIPSGTVTFTYPGGLTFKVLGTATLVPMPPSQVGSETPYATATLKVAATAFAGKSSADVTATYLGSLVFAPSSGSVNQQILKDPTTTTITSSANPISPTQKLTFTATVTSQFGTPTGNVTFTYIVPNGVSLGKPVTATVPLALGTASYAVPASTLPGGPSTVTATYGGSATFGISSQSLVQVVQ